MSDIEIIKDAIRTHRDKRGDDRCWIDDYELYAVLGEPFETVTKGLPCLGEFLSSCHRYWHQRQPTGFPISMHPPDPEDMSDPSTLTIGQLEREIAKFKANATHDHEVIVEATKEIETLRNHICYSISIAEQILRIMIECNQTHADPPQDGSPYMDSMDTGFSSPASDCLESLIKDAKELLK